MSNAFLFVFYGILGVTIGFHCDKTVDHCFTSINIKTALTMNGNTVGQVYAKSRELYKLPKSESLEDSPVIPIPIDDIISADGWNLTRNLITANGTMPGPSIFIYENQTITIIVNNLLINEAVTIHWHGIDQLEHPAMDGVAFVSQCPIMPGQSFNYTFHPKFGGSYWYHSHVGNQRDMGLFGAFIVLRKKHHLRVPFMNQHILQIQEWNHQYDAQTLLDVNDQLYDTSPHSILINGRGQFKDILAPIETFNVRKGGQHRFRLIAVGSHCTLLFSISGLKLNVVETDGFEIVPVVVDKIIIFPAERYDFEIDLDYAEERVYNITVSVLSSPSLTIGDNIGLGFLNVQKGDSSAMKFHTNDHMFRVLNCPFQVYPQRDDFICVPVTDLKSLGNIDDNDFNAEHVKETNEKALHFLNFGFPGDHSSINGRIFRWPTVAPLTQPSETDTDCDKCGDENTCICSHTLNLKSGSEVTMILLNLGSGAAISHPIHMHGHTFEVLKMGFPEVKNDGQFILTNDIKCSETLSNEQSQCNNAKWRNASWNNYQNIPGINLKDTVRKDTIVIPYGGYVIIRIDATNPGVWFMHCHIDKHMVNGMALMLNESFENQNRYIPKELPTCHSYLRTMAGVVNDLSSKQKSSTDSAKTVYAVVFGLTTGLIIILFGYMIWKKRSAAFGYKILKKRSLQIHEIDEIQLVKKQT